jgi:hypothetical protein
MSTASNEAQIQLALQALENDPDLSVRKAAVLYSVSRKTLGRRSRGKPARIDTTANSRNLDVLEEQVIIRRVLDLYEQGFAPGYSVVEDMANLLRQTRGASRVGQHWARNFVQRQPELRTRWSRPYDYQRAKCEDPEIICAWFDLFRNVVAKHGILESDIWNFDETGFLMGQISSTLVITSSDGRTKAKKIQPGNREWVTAIQAVRSDGEIIPPYLVVAGKTHLESWYRDSPFPPEWTIDLSETGWTNNRIGLDWIKHFDRYSRPRMTGAKRLLVLDGHESHHSAEFEEYCKENNIITLCMPPHSSHLLQPLDVGCFSVLKRAYSREIEKMMRNHIHHITKPDFFLAFHAAFLTTFTPENVRGGFRGAGLVPLDPQKVISQLDIKLRTPTPTGPPLPSADPWVSKTPQNATEASQQSAHIRNRITRHQNSSPTSIFEALDQITKGTMKVMHKMVLMEAQVRELKAANEALSKRRRAKKSRIRAGGPLNLHDATDILADKDLQAQLEEETRLGVSRSRRRAAGPRHCSTCGKTGHNIRTCREDVEMDIESDSE